MAPKKLGQSDKSKLGRNNKFAHPSRSIKLSVPEEILLAPLIWDDPEFRRHLNKNPTEKQKLLAHLRKQHEIADEYANSPQMEAHFKEMGDAWESLSREDQERQREEAMNFMRKQEWKQFHFGQDWSGARSTERLPDYIVNPVFDFICKNKKILGNFVDISNEDIEDAENHLSIPIERFATVLQFMNSSDPVAKALNLGNYRFVERVLTLTETILKAWASEDLSSISSTLDKSDIQRLAATAAKAVAAHIDNQEIAPIVDGKIIDPATGLSLPPEPGRPYRERRYHPDGTRLSIFEHLREEYGPYLDSHLLFSGHLQDIDKPAYDALLYLARKDARSRPDADEISNTAAFFLQHGILAGEHLEFPPEHLSRQVDLINKSRAISIVPRIRGRRPTQSKEGTSR